MIDYDAKYKEYLDERRNFITNRLEKEWSDLSFDSNSQFNVTDRLFVPIFLIGGVIVGLCREFCGLALVITAFVIWIGLLLWYGCFADNRKEYIAEFVYKKYLRKRIILAIIQDDKEKAISALTCEILHNHNLSHEEWDKNKQQLSDIEFLYSHIAYHIVDEIFICGKQQL